MPNLEQIIRINKLGEEPLPTREEFDRARNSYTSHVTIFSESVQQSPALFNLNGELSETELTNGNLLIGNLCFGYDLVHVKYLGIPADKSIYWDPTPPKKPYWDAWWNWSDNERGIFATHSVDDDTRTSIGINIYWFTGILKYGNMLGYASDGVNFDSLEDNIIFAGFEEAAHNLRWTIGRFHLVPNVDDPKTDYLTYIKTNDYEYQAFLVQMIMSKFYFPQYYTQFQKVYAELRQLRQNPEDRK